MVKYLISELADKCGVNKETIRYYERFGLIPVPTRTNAGYRTYQEETVNRIQFIKRMQDLGFFYQKLINYLELLIKTMNDVWICMIL